MPFDFPVATQQPDLVPPAHIRGLGREGPWAGGQQGEGGEVSGPLPLSLRCPCSAWPVLSCTGPALAWCGPCSPAPGSPVPPDGGASQDPRRLSTIPCSPAEAQAAGLVLGLLSQLLSQPPGPKSPGVWDLPPLGLRHLITSILGLALFPLPWPLGLADPTPPGGVRLLWHHLPDQVFAEANSAHNDGLVLG